MNSENIITIMGYAFFATWLILICIIALWRADHYERSNRNAIKRGNEYRNAELRGQGRLLVASNSVTRGE